MQFELYLCKMVYAILLGYKEHQQTEEHRKAIFNHMQKLLSRFNHGERKRRFNIADKQMWETMKTLSDKSTNDIEPEKLLIIFYHLLEELNQAGKGLSLESPIRKAMDCLLDILSETYNKGDSNTEIRIQTRLEKCKKQVPKLLNLRVQQF